MIQLIPTPYRILAGVVAVALVGLTLYAVGWSRGADAVNTRWDQAKTIQLQAALAAEQQHRAREIEWNRRLQEAEHAASDREQKLRADSAAAHAAARSLRDTVAALSTELSTAPAEACRATAAAALAVLSECSGRYRAVAEAADGHASDVRTLTEAWPSGPKNQ